MIYTVFPQDENVPPMDFDTEKKAEEYAREVKCQYDVESVILSTDGEVV